MTGGNFRDPCISLKSGGHQRGCGPQMRRPAPLSKVLTSFSRRRYAQTVIPQMHALPARQRELHHDFLQPTTKQGGSGCALTDLLRCAAHRLPSLGAYRPLILHRTARCHSIVSERPCLDVQSFFCAISFPSGISASEDASGVRGESRCRRCPSDRPCLVGR